MQVILWQIYITNVYRIHQYVSTVLILLKMLPLFFTCFKYATFRDVLCQTIQYIFDCDHIFHLYLLLYRIPDHGLITNTQILVFEAVHTYIAATKLFI